MLLCAGEVFVLTNNVGYAFAYTVPAFILARYLKSILHVTSFFIYLVLGLCLLAHITLVSYGLFGFLPSLTWTFFKIIANIILLHGFLKFLP